MVVKLEHVKSRQSQQWKSVAMVCGLECGAELGLLAQVRGDYFRHLHVILWPACVQAEHAPVHLAVRAHVLVEAVGQQVVIHHLHMVAQVVHLVHRLRRHMDGLARTLGNDLATHAKAAFNAGPKLLVSGTQELLLVMASEI